MKNIFAIVLLLMLGGCASFNSLSYGGGESPPEELSNMCEILAEKPHWADSLVRVKQKYGVPQHVILAVMHQESKFIHDARPLSKSGRGLFGTRYQSSAYGYSQALDLTWADYKARTGNHSAKRDRFEDAAMFMGWYMDNTNAQLKLSKWDAEVQYLAYHEGHGGYRSKSYVKKPWLRKIAKKVSKRSSKYWEQYQHCASSFDDSRNFFSRYFL